ncbi:MAG: transglycosylase SLT domain-containing protein [bacterium]|nr:transglycosylase SLT domain-containing protein [bacterium]
MIRTAFAQAITSLPSISGAPAPDSPAALVAYIYMFALAIVGLATLIAFLIGAFRYFFAVGSPGAVADAKDRMLHAVLGFFVVIASVIILYNINPDFLRLRSPGFPTLALPASSDRTPGECGFTLAQWTGPLGEPRQRVGLVVATADCEDGEVIAFHILNSVGVEIAQTSGVIANDRAQAFWTTPAALNTRYYFKATTAGGQSITSGALEIGGELAEGSELVFGTCADVPAGSAAPSTCGAPCTTTVEDCNDIIRKAAQQHRIPAALIVSIMWQECSSGDPNCQSSAGSCGLMRVNPQFVRDPNSECKPWLGETTSDPARACEIMMANPEISINVGACMLRNATIAADRARSEHHYPGTAYLHTAAAYNGGVGSLLPSCNCRNQGEAPYADSNCVNSTVCLNCATSIPKWLCTKDSPSPDVCVPNTGFAETRQYAASVENYYAHFVSCPEWQ